MRISYLRAHPSCCCRLMGCSGPDPVGHLVTQLQMSSLFSRWGAVEEEWAMPGVDSTTSWCDHKSVPADADHEAIPGLVKLARRARHQVVESDWAFSRDDLQQPRQAVYEWGSGSRGTYKRFNARVLDTMYRKTR